MKIIRIVSEKQNVDGYGQVTSIGRMGSEIVLNRTDAIPFSSEETCKEFASKIFAWFLSDTSDVFEFNLDEDGND